MQLGFKTIAAMRIIPGTALLLLASLMAFGQGAPPCAVGDVHCIPQAMPASKAELKQARKEFEHAQKLQREGKLPQALDALERAVDLAPQVPDYLSAREMVRQQIVTNHINLGNELLASHKTIEALAEFRQALEIDPHNEFALQRLQDATPRAILTTPTSALSPALTVVSQSTPVVISAQPGLHEFHLKGASRNVLEQIAAPYGIKLIFDDTVSSKAIRFDIEPVDFFTAFREVAKIAHIFWVPITSKQLILFNDTQQLRRDNERTVSATFYMTDASSPQELTDVVNMLRTLFDVRFAVPQPSTNSIVVRAPVAIVEAATKVLDKFLTRKPQVLISIKVFQISHMLTESLGFNPQTQFQAINVGAAALSLLGQGNTQELINQLIASGGINQANSQALQALLSQLQNQQNSSISSLLNTPFVTFGGGKTLYAIPITGLNASFSYSPSDVQSLQTIDLRTSQGNAATLRIGSRYPILNASFAPVFNSSAISSAIQNGSYTAPFPSFSYEDLGITVKATPQVLGDSTINLKLELEIKALTGQSFNGVPVLSNQNYTATMSVLDGCTTAIVGMITKSEQKSLSGLPGFSYIPGLNIVTSNRSKQNEADELLIVVTPTILSPAHSASDGTEVWVPTT